MTLKNTLMASATALALIATPATFATEATNTLTDQEQNQQLAGVGSGALIGGLAAGPAGAIVASAISLLFVDKHQSAKRFEHNALEERRQTDTLEQELASVSADLGELQLALDAAQLQAEELRVHATELTRQRDLLRSIDHEVRFATDTYELADADLARLLKLSSVVAQLPGSEVRLEGYADVRGDDDYNEILSLDRAYAVAEAMNSFGVAKEQIRTYAFGESESTAVDHLTLGQDRRVSIQFAPSSGPGAEQELAARIERARHYTATRRAHVCETSDDDDENFTLTEVSELSDAPVATNAAGVLSDSNGDSIPEATASESMNIESTLRAYTF